MKDIFCGLKLTHDGSVAIIEENRLLFSIEAEKLENRPRYSSLNRWSDLVGILEGWGVSPEELTAVSVDGWGRRNGVTQVYVVDGTGRHRPVEVAEYHDRPGSTDDPLNRQIGAAEIFGEKPTKFRSFSHATDHALASYCTSPYAARGESSLIVVWDGGMPPCLYHYDPVNKTLRPLRWLLEIVGGLYPVFASHLGPFLPGSDALDTDLQKLETLLLPISGKAMAYAALGKPDDEAISIMSSVTLRKRPTDPVGMYQWSRAVLREISSRSLSDAILMASLQEYLGSLIVDSLRQFVGDHREFLGTPICLSGGCALNIKWNAKIRASELFSDVWVPPIPNDAGSALGAACAEMIRHTGKSDLQWSVFAGPEILPPGETPTGWSSRPCTLGQLAELLAIEGEPVAVITGRAEIGPRALGHRSIIAPATTPTMRNTLNKLKNREGYRPVAPICLEEAAPSVFSPGSPDPYMLFEHQVHPEWRGRVPAIVHVDGSARLQTVNSDNPVMYELLRAYLDRTGVPVLCNTSANFNGSGFFPDVNSVLRWGQVQYVWSAGTLFFRADASASRDAPS